MSEKGKMHTVLQRLKNDFRLSIITLVGLSAIIGITPFAIFRFMAGNLLMGVVDSLIMLGISSGMVFSWRTGNTRITGFFMAISASLGAVAVANILGVTGVFWMFPAFVTTFFLATRRLAICINLTMLLGLSLQRGIFDDLHQVLSFVVTGAITIACAWFFSVRHEDQRKQLQKLATHDPLTGAHNRRAMDNALDHAVKTADRAGAAYGLLLLDLDHFKKVNDIYGHSVGDRVLVECADVIRSRIRKADQVFRYGGEEFVVLLTGVKLEGLEKVAQVLRRNIARNIRTPIGPITASFGAAKLRETESAKVWLQRADDALYRAKNSGRNCIVIAEPEYPDPIGAGPE